MALDEVTKTKTTTTTTTTTNKQTNKQFENDNTLLTRRVSCVPSKVTFSEQVESRSVVHPQMVEQQERMLQVLRQKDAQIRRLTEGKRFYEEVFGDLCQEAGLFELDQDDVI